MNLSFESLCLDPASVGLDLWWGCFAVIAIFGFFRVCCGRPLERKKYFWVRLLIILLSLRVSWGTWIRWKACFWPSALSTRLISHERGHRPKWTIFSFDPISAPWSVWSISNQLKPVWVLPFYARDSCPYVECALDMMRVGRQRLGIFVVRRSPFATAYVSILPFWVFLSCAAVRWGGRAAGWESVLSILASINYLTLITQPQKDTRKAKEWKREWRFRLM